MEKLHDLLRPAFGASPLRGADVPFGWSREKGVGVGESAFEDPIHPDQDGRSEGFAGLCERANDVGNRIAAGRDDLIAQPAHSSGMLDAVDDGE